MYAILVHYDSVYKCKQPILHTEDISFTFISLFLQNVIDMFKKKKFPFWEKRDIGVFTYIWTAQSLT